MIREVNLKDDYKQIARMYFARGLRPIKKEYLSDTGFIMHGKCAVFVYKTNSKVCIIENLIAHKECEKHDITNLILHAVKWSKQQGFELVVGVTLLDVVKQYAHAFGSKVHNDYSLFFKKLN